MGMPIITPGDSTWDEAATDIIESVALQEASLSHILNAEGEKMEVLINMEDIAPEELLRVNRAAELLISAVTRLEMILQAKLDIIGQTTDTSCGILNNPTRGEFYYGKRIR